MSYVLAFLRSWRGVLGIGAILVAVGLYFYISSLQDDIASWKGKAEHWQANYQMAKDAAENNAERLREAVEAAEKRETVLAAERDEALERSQETQIVIRRIESAPQGSCPVSEPILRAFGFVRQHTGDGDED